MRSVLLATAALAAAATTGLAADLPRRSVPNYAPLPPAFTWTGPYLGLNLGGAFSLSDRNALVAVGPGTFGAGSPPVTSTLLYGKRERGGFTGGVHGGFNYQFAPDGGLVVGVEADLQYAGLTSKRPPTIATLPAFAVPASVLFVDPRGSRGVDWFGTVRGRAGWAFDRLLVYGTGGLAYGEGNAGACFGAFGCGDNLRMGWTGGAGVEYAMPTDSFMYMRGGALTLRAEALYVSLDHGRNAGLFAYNTATNAAFFAPGIGKDSDDFAVIRAGLTYKFGW